jgi:KUP system potassium uptake protein
MTTGAMGSAGPAGDGQTSVVSPHAGHSPDATGSHSSSSFRALFIGSIGVVYGDIGTSPLYALREAVMAASGGHQGIERETVLGVLSLILWALMVIVTFKYVLVLLRADNDGEGGTLSLMALAQRAMGRQTRSIFLLGVCGAALFFGDAMITPAISVLSAVEGTKLIAPQFEAYILPTTVAIIFALFFAQRRGTAKVAAWFGPIMVAWMIVMALGGLIHIFDDPQIFAAINPWHGVHFLVTHGGVGLLALGAVFLSVTGAEALYADLGHFGKKPIQRAWLTLVFPALALNYLGQGALLLSNPTALENPFFRLYPADLLPLIVLLATAATIIASQAVITGA